MKRWKTFGPAMALALAFAASPSTGFAAQKRIYAEENISFFSKDHPQKTEVLGSLWAYKDGNDVVITGTLDSKHLHVSGNRVHLDISLIDGDGKILESKTAGLRFAPGKYKSLRGADFFVRFAGLSDAARDNAKIQVEAHNAEH